MFSKTVKRLKDNKEIVLFIFFSFLAWRVWLQVFLWLGWYFFPIGESYLGQHFLGGGLERYLTKPDLFTWANFDGEHYLSIAQRGYGNFEQAFFPLYPTLIRWFTFIKDESIFPYLISGLTISHLSFILALYLFYRLVRLDYADEVARRTIFLLLVFPVSFFFGGAYTESLFFLLLVGAFYSARAGKWWLAGLLGMFASATKIMGILILPALLWEWWEQKKNIKDQISNIKYLFNLVPIFFVATGLLLYMRHLAIYYQDPLMFVHAQPVFGAQRVVEKIVLPYQVFWRYLKMIADTKGDPLFFTVWLEFLTAIIFIVLMIIGYLRKVRVSYLIFAILSFLLPSLTGTFSSLPRYVLVMFPCFITLALIKKRGVRFLWVVVNILILAMATIFFTRGYFVA